MRQWIALFRDLMKLFSGLFYAMLSSGDREALANEFARQYKELEEKYTE